MTTYLAVLRAINLGPRNRIAMADLRAMLEKLGFADPRTIVVSGNVVFRGDSAPTATIEALLESASTKHLGVTTDYFVRTAKEWQAIIKANPFPAEAENDPGRLVMMCLRDAPSPAAVQALRAAIKGREIVRAKGKSAYFLYPDGQGRSKLTIQMIEKAFNTRGTARNWNTVLKLGEMAS